MRLALEVEGGGSVSPPGGGEALVALMSFAVSRGFGASHPLIALADRLHDTHRVPLGPLTTFYEADVEDAEDAEKLELAWQPAEGLRGSLEGLLSVLESDPQAQALVARAGAGALADEAASLLPAIRDAETRGARVRLSYTL